MCEFSDGGDFGSDVTVDSLESTDSLSDDISLDDTSIIEDIPEDIDFEMDTVSADDLSADAEMIESSIDLSEVDTDDFKGFLVDEAEASGDIEDIAEDIDYETDDISASDLSSDAEPISSEFDLSEAETEEFKGFIIEEAEQSGEFNEEFRDIEKNVIQDNTESTSMNDSQENTLSVNDVEWSIENLSKDDLVQLRDGIASGEITVIEDEYPDDEGYARVRTR